MKKIIKAVVTTVCVFGLMVFIGCAMVQDIVTPCYVNEDLIKDSGQSATSFMPFTSVFDAERILGYATFNYQEYVRMCQNCITEATERHTFLTNTQAPYITVAKAFQEKFFSPTGVGALIPAGLGTFLGAMYINTPKKKKTTTA